MAIRGHVATHGIRPQVCGDIARGGQPKATRSVSDERHLIDRLSHAAEWVAWSGGDSRCSAARGCEDGAMVDAFEVGVAEGLVHVPGRGGCDREQRGRRSVRTDAAEGDIPFGRQTTGIEDELVGVVEPADGKRGCPADASSLDRKVLDRPV